MRAGAASLLLAALVEGFSGCGPGSSPDGTGTGSSQAQTAASGIPDGIARAGLLLEVAHEGVRRVEVYDRTVAPPRFLAYREKIVTDGKGRFSLEPLEAITPVAPDWNSFQLLQRVREDYVFRYRDFAIRDAELFRANYVLRDLGVSSEIAGRAASSYRVERKQGAGTYEIAVDDQTGLVLRYRQLDGEGRELSSMVYETYDAAPDLTRFRPYTAVAPPYELDETWDLAVQIRQEVHTPRLLPEGYALRRAVTLQDGVGQNWLRLTYTDGVESLFYLSQISNPFRAAGAPTPLGPDTLAPSEVMVFRMGAALAAQGAFQGREFVAVGKVPEPELLDMIESAF